MNQPKRIKLEDQKTLTAVLSDDLIEETPLMEVFVATIKEQKNISRVIVELNALLPNPDLVHLKRVRGKQVLLSPVQDSSNVLEVLKSKHFDVSLIEENSIENLQVAKIPPKVRKQYETVNKLWPCNFHADKYLEKLVTNTLFTDNDLKEHIRFMQIALDIRDLTKSTSSAVIVDFKHKTPAVVAHGFDQSDENPNKHCVMVAIDNVAKTQKGGVWAKHELEEAVSDMIKKKYGEMLKCVSDEDDYLCTGYSAFLTREPCVTCAMALVHSRIKRVFYGTRRADGALGSSCKIHLVANLNHHYEAFAGLLEDECNKLLV